MFCLAQPASSRIPGPSCDRKRKSQQSSITLHCALQQRTKSQAQFLVRCQDQTAEEQRPSWQEIKNSFSPESSKLHCAKGLSAGIKIQFPLVFTHSTQAEEAVKITRFLIAMCFFHLGKADLGCTSMSCVYYTPQKKRICIALYGLWTRQTVLSPWETHFAFLSRYSIPSHHIPCHPLPCGFDWFGGCFLFKETLKRWHGSWWQPVFNRNI